MIESGLLSTAVYVANDKHAPLHPPKNKGHEAMIYLTYIIDNYEKLADVSIFMHAHQFTWHNNELLDGDAAQMVRHLSPERVSRLGYMNLRCHWDPGCPDWLHPGSTRNLYDRKEEAVIAAHWAELFPNAPLPTVLSQPCCAQFAVSKERILAMPKSRYVFMRKWILRTKLNDYLSGRVFEYTWQYIFTDAPVDCPSMSACYCDGYGFCFGSPAAFDRWFELRYNLNDMKEELRMWWVKMDLLDEFRKFSREGRMTNMRNLEPPEPGRDEVLIERIKEVWAEMKERRKEAFELGRDPAQRALESGRDWKEGDGF